MRELNSKELDLIAELGLPINAIEIPLESCSCGILNCSEHESWSTLVLSKIFGCWDGPELPKGWIEEMFRGKVVE